MESQNIEPLKEIWAYYVEEEEKREQLEPPI